jgi:integrase
VTAVRQFAKYVVGTGKYAYIIPGKIPGKQVRYDAHIFTEQELLAYFASIDKCQKSPFSPFRCYVIPVFFRLLFTCGLRSTETRLLCTKDVDLKTGKIFIRQSKGWEARIIYVSDDLLELLCRYDDIVKKAFPEREAFFPNIKGTYYNKSTPGNWFHEFWDQLPEASVAKGNSPRVHDFRHTFCVYRLNQWVQEGKDINALYPYLSEYMGHSNFADTDYYLTLAESFYPELQKRMHSVNVQILPEVLHES